MPVIKSIALDLFSKLAVAQNQIAVGDKGRTLKQVMTDIRKRLHESSKTPGQAARHLRLL